MARKKKNNYSELERMIRVWDIEKVKDLMSRRTFYDANDAHEEELRDLWVSEPEFASTASFGRNWGYYVGMDEIKRYYVDQFKAKRQKELDACVAAGAPIENKPENLGYGSFSIHPLSTPHVVLAGDGKTAQGTWYSIGQDSVAKPDGSADGKWHCQLISGDFVKESDGSWKIWHLFVSSDFMVQSGHSVGELQSIYIRGTSQDEIDFGEPTIDMLAHDPSYAWMDNYPPLGKPYETFTEDIGYGPLGHPNYEDEE